ncbi:MAG: hypothetical protein FWC66_09890, partial [Oscillospiraceae bacterium]|nr:hypothetical protein [Oscillospiraceae bacterium]
KTMYIARKTIKDKLEGTDQKKAAKGTAMASFAALFFLEEQAFAASYVSIAAPSIAGAGIAGKVATAAVTSTKGYVIAACVAAVCAATAAVYVVSQPAAPDYVYVQPTYEVYLPAAEALATVEDMDDMEDIVEEGNLPELVEEAWLTESEAAWEQTEELQEMSEPELPEASADENELDEPESEPVPEPIDRTPEILAALATARTAGDVNGIISRYGFVLDTSIRDATEKLFRFYVLNDGSGDILIGTTIHEDGTGWRMRFAHFTGGRMPTDMLDLFRFME